MLAGASAVIVVASVVATNATAGTDRKHPGSSAVRVELIGVDGAAVGWVMLHEMRDKVVVSGLAQGLTPGFHGFHIHAVGVCDPAAPTGPFVSAGGHYNPTLLNHGDHAGDMPPLLVTADGHAYTSFATDRFSLDSLARRGRVRGDGARWSRQPCQHPGAIHGRRRGRTGQRDAGYW